MRIKKIVFSMIALSLLVGLLPRETAKNVVQADAPTGTPVPILYTSSDGRYQYDKNGDTGTVTLNKYIHSSQEMEVTLPKEVDGYPVTGCIDYFMATDRFSGEKSI